MRQKEKRTPAQKQDARFVIFFVLIGIVMMLGMLWFGIEYSQHQAQKAMNRNVSDLKKQITEYNEFLSTNEAKNLIRLTEKAENISKTLALLDESSSQEYLKSVYDNQRMSLVMVLDENLEPDSSLNLDLDYSTAEEDYEEWKDVLQDSAVTSILERPKKIYSVRLSRGENDIYYIAAAAREDKKGIVFCVAQEIGEVLELHNSPVRNLLATNETSLKGTLCIAENGKVLATNQAQTYTNIEEIPEILAMQEQNVGNTLTKFEANGATFFGGIVKCRSYDIFAFYPSSAVYASCRTIVMVAIVIYMLIGFVISWFYLRSRMSHVRALNRQYEIIDAISHIYSFTVLIDIKTKHYKLLKYPPEWDNVTKEGTVDEQFYEKFIGHVDERFRSGYHEFLNPETLNVRLAEEKHVEYEYQNNAGEWLDDNLIVHEKDEEGEINSVVLVQKNINEQKKTELEHQAKLEEAIRNEQKAHQSKTDFLRRMSHDIRTPINVVLGMLEIGSRNPTDTELLSSCRVKAQTAAQYLLELVNDILTINKADDENGGSAQTTEVFRLQEEVQKLYLIVAERAKDYDGIVLEPPQLSGEDKPLIGESLYLRQIMMNIIINAMRYSEKGGTVRFSVSQNPSKNRYGYAEVCFVCVDNGIGMSREFQQRMFEPFAQESNTGISRFDGVGLGLSIVQKLINRLNGTIEVESEQGRGTRFEIMIPYPYADEPTATEPQTQESASLAGLTVLIVEDNELNMDIARFMVTEAGANVITAVDGITAVEKFAASAVGEIDVILTDVVMPQMDGLEETRRIRALDRPDAKSVPIIAMTANLFEEDIREYMGAGMTGVLAKPLNMTQLSRTVASQVAKGGKNNE